MSVEENQNLVDLLFLAGCTVVALIVAGCLWGVYEIIKLVVG